MAINLQRGYGYGYNSNNRTCAASERQRATSTATCPRCCWPFCVCKLGNVEDQQQAQQPAQDGQPTTPTTPTTAQQTQQPAQSTPTTPATTQQPVQPDPQEVFAKQYDERIAEVYKEADAELTQISDEYVGYVREVADSAEQFYATIADLEVDAQAYKQQADATYQAARSILTRIAGMIQQSGGTMDVSAISLLAQELDLSYQRSGMAKHALQMQKQQELQAQRAQRAQTVQQELARFQQQRDPQKRAQARQVANIERNTQAKFTAAGLSAFDYQEARADTLLAHSAVRS